MAAYVGLNPGKDITWVIHPRAEALPDRLVRLQGLLNDLIDHLAPDEVAIEQPFVARNVRSAFVVGEVRGVALLAAAGRGLPVHQYSPARVKMTVAGHGGAGKTEVARSLALHLSLPPGAVPLDATDALAVALCHALHQRAAAAGLTKT
jgi:crossover junction endodeoxyribonuclease RuvC